MSYQTYSQIRDAHGLRDADVIKATGITKSTFSEWKKGTYQPQASEHGSAQRLAQKKPLLVWWNQARRGIINRAMHAHFFSPVEVIIQKDFPFFPK